MSNPDRWDTFGSMAGSPQAFHLSCRSGSAGVLAGICGMDMLSGAPGLAPGLGMGNLQ
ncbi:MAG TPA: hypothetical protein V6C52_08090 [Coleofasciculaceae cyanobacterium]